MTNHLFARTFKIVALCAVCFFALTHSTQARNITFEAVADTAPKKAATKATKSSSTKSTKATNSTKPKTTTNAKPKATTTTTPKAGTKPTAPAPSASKDCQRKAIKAIAPVFTTVAEQVMIKPACGSAPAQYITVSKQVVKTPATYEESMEPCACSEASKVPVINEVMGAEKTTSITKKDCDGKTTTEQIVIRPSVKEFKVSSPK